MADEEHLSVLKQGIEAWNEWRFAHKDIRPNLSGADLSGAYLGERNMLLGRVVNLCEANLHGANLSRSFLLHGDLRKADLSGANLKGAVLVNTDLTQANLSRCRISGLSAWQVKLEGTIQSELIITAEDEPVVTVDNLYIAHFIHLLLNNTEIHQPIDPTITPKAVLILGCFISERKAVLDALQVELRKRKYTPISFELENPAARNLTQILSTFAHLAQFQYLNLAQNKGHIMGS